MAAFEQNNSLDMILIGKTGDGKSETGNSILGREVFRTSCAAGSSTIKAQYDCGHIDGFDLKIVDCPGLGDTRLDKKNDLLQFIEAIKVAISNNPRGYHAFLYVIKFVNKVTIVDEMTIFTLKQLLGDPFFKNHGILVMTYGDCFVRRYTCPFNDWLRSQDNEIFKNILKECSYRAVLFDNATQDPYKKITQTRELVEIIESLFSKRQRYTNEDFIKANKKRDKLLNLFREEEEKLEFIDKIGPLISELKNVPDDEENSATLCKVGLKIDELENSVKKALLQNPSLKDISSLVTNVQGVFKVKKKQEVNMKVFKEKGAKNEKERIQFHESRYKDLIEIRKKIEELEKKYVIVKNNSAQPIISKLMESLNKRFFIEKLFERLVEFFSK